MQRTPPLAALPRAMRTYHLSRPSLWLHPSKRYGLAYPACPRVAPLPVDAAYATARWLVDAMPLTPASLPTVVGQTADAAAVHRRFRAFAKTALRDKVQMQLTLRAFHDVLSELGTAGRGIIAPLVGVVRALEAAAVAFLEGVVDVVPSATGCLDDLDRKSVVRMWVYQPGSDGCRPHSDPGLVTAMLPGSEPGLGLTLDHLPTRVGRPGDYTEYDATLVDTAVQWHSIADVMHGASLQARDDAILVFSNATLCAMTQTAMPPVVHRVGGPSRCVASGAGDGPPRVNIVVELRPVVPRRWYGFAPTAEEAQRLAAYVGGG